MNRSKLDRARRQVNEKLLEALERREGLIIVKAPPGSGKTYITLRGMALAFHRGCRVAVATQTNNQADDLCQRFAAAFPKMPIYRLTAKGQEAPSQSLPSIHWVDDIKLIPDDRCLVVATSAKWTAIQRFEPFDWLFIDEAWQLSWAEFMLLGAVAGRFVLVGDPGQIEPTVRIDVARWQTTHRKPHMAAPELLMTESNVTATVLELPVSTRLPWDTVELVRPFYDFHFDSWTQAGDRQFILPSPGDDRDEDQVCHLLTMSSVVLMKLPTPDYAPSVEDDRELADAVAALARRLLERGAEYRMEEMEQREELRPEDIGVAATHKLMVSRLSEALGELGSEIRCDTVERWQGLERKMMIVVHPLSGQLNPGAFDLNTGRLNVMLSRHQIGVVLVSRDHVGKTLAQYAGSADQALGAIDEAGQGHCRHLGIWNALESTGRSASIS